MKNYPLLTILLSLISFVPLVKGHAVLVNPPARAGQAVGVGIKYYGSPTTMDFNGCEGAPAGPSMATLTSGQTLNVAWNITIPHVSDPGVYVGLLMGGQRTELLQTPVDAGLGSTNVVIPNVASTTAAVIHWLWHSAQDGGFYVGCSDVTLNPIQTPAAQTALQTPAAQKTTVSLSAVTAGNAAPIAAVTAATTTAAPLIPASSTAPVAALTGAAPIAAASTVAATTNIVSILGVLTGTTKNGTTPVFSDRLKAAIINVVNFLVAHYAANAAATPGIIPPPNGNAR